MSRKRRPWLVELTPLVVVCLTLLLGCAPSKASRDISGYVFPTELWTWKPAETAGFDPVKLQEFVRFTRGSGCVVHRGYMVRSWGRVQRRLDVASLAKPFLAHFVFLAVDQGKLNGLDKKVARHEPRLKALNAAAGYPDGDITWRHMAMQSSCYGVSEAPGEAFNYDDYQMALMVDTLVQSVYGLTYEAADEELLRPFLTARLQCQDEPTLRAEQLPEGRLSISTRDLARLGLLYLAMGSWGEDRLISQDAVSEATGRPHPAGFPRTRAVPAEMISSQRSYGGGSNQEDHVSSYSFGWWVNAIMPDGEYLLPDAPPDTYAAIGYGGVNALVIIPSRDLVVTWLYGLPAGRAVMEDGDVFSFSQSGRQQVNAALKLLLASAPDP